MTLRIYIPVVLLTGVFACTVEPSDPRAEGSTGEETLEAFVYQAPFRLVPAALEPGGPRLLVMSAAEVMDVGTGTLVIEGYDVAAVGGALRSLQEFELGPGGRLIPGSLGAALPPIELSPGWGEPLPSLRALVRVDAAIDGLIVDGYIRAVLFVDRPIEIVGPVVVDASTWFWAPGSYLQYDAPGPPNPVAVVPETAHALDPERAVVDGVPPGSEPRDHLLPGDPCDATAHCPADTRCVADPTNSDGTFRCLAEVCGGTQHPGVTCLDDLGCCRQGDVCNDAGMCITPSGGDGGGSADGAGCDCDRDDDGVINLVDRNPDQSCSADQDQDGCNDSCDANDSDPSNGCSGSSSDGMQDEGNSCFGCRARRIARPNSTAFAFLLLLLARTRRPSAISGLP